MNGMTIGKLAGLTGVSVDTIRYYERRGLIGPSSRRESGYREYDEAEVGRVRFIVRAKRLGFTLREIGDLLALRSVPGADCGNVREHARQKLHDIDGKIRDLRNIQSALAGLVASCSGRGPLAECTILELLSGDESSTEASEVTDTRDPPL